MFDLWQMYRTGIQKARKFMFRQFFSILTVIFCLLSHTLSAKEISIDNRGIVTDEKYIGSYLEVLSEGLLVRELEHLETLPEEYQEILRSGQMTLNPHVAAWIDRSEEGVYRAHFKPKSSDTESFIQWGLEDIENPGVRNQFTQSQNDIPFIDFTDHAHWFRLTFNNISQEQKEVILELDKNSYSWFDLLYRKEGKIHFFKGSYEAPMSEREIQENEVLFPIGLRPGKTQVYLRMENQFYDSVPILLWTPEEYYRVNNVRKFLHGLTSGITLLLAFYALYLARSLKAKGYLFLSLLILIGYFVHISDSGLGMTLFWPQQPMFSITLFAVAMPLTVLVNISFCRHFLQIQNHLPMIDWICKILLILTSILFIIQFFIPLGDRYAFTMISVLLDYFSVIPLLGAALIIYKRAPQKNSSSLYLIIAISFQLISYLEYWLSRFNIIPLNLIDFIHVRSIGFALVMLGGVRSQLYRLERTITSLRENLGKIINEKSSKSPKKSMTDETLLKVEAVKDFIEKNYTEHLYRDDLAASVNLSRDHLGRMFKQLTGEKISDYINKLRIEESCLQLLVSEKKIIDIAFAVGFENLRTFNLCFAKWKGLSPRDYRQKKQVPGTPDT